MCVVKAVQGERVGVAALKNVKITYNPSILIKPVVFFCGILSGFSHSFSLDSVLFYNLFTANKYVFLSLSCISKCCSWKVKEEVVFH